MSLIVVEGVSKSWSDKDVLRNIRLTLSPREHVGLVGPNGEGKTTLLRILAGIEPATEGTIQRKNDLRVGYLPQDPPALAGSTLRQAMLEVFAPLRAIERELHELTARLEADQADDKALSRYGQLQHQFEDAGGYTYPQRIEQVLSGLGLAADLWDRPLAHLSGGQRTRAYIGRLLLEEPDVLLLDEPTNHLDFEAVQWLEDYLQGFRGALVVVSHDRYFLDRATTKTWEVAFTALECYSGSYSQYVTQRDQRFLDRMRTWESQQEYIRETEDFIRRFLAGQRSSEAKGRRTRLARFLKTEAIAKPRRHGRISVRFKVMERTGDFVLHLKELKVGYEPARALLSIESLDIERGQRVAIVGPNGCGKTTLLKTILRQLPPLAGEARLGAGVHLGYVSQTHAELLPEMTALDAVRLAVTGTTEQHARNLLGSLLLSEEDVFKQISQLSGGQRSRVVLARLMLQKANVLVMDEPTNHLDINSQEVLQDVLSDFDGTLIFVSHDRYLIEALATHVWAVQQGTVRAIVGGWEKYLEYLGREAGEGGKAVTPAQAAKQQRAEARETRQQERRERRRAANEVRKLRKRFEEVEQRIHALEDELKAMTAAITDASAAGETDKIAQLGAEYAGKNEGLRELYAEWEDLASAMEEG